MAKIEEARQLLKSIGMPQKQQNLTSALTLLALAGVREKDIWAKAERSLLRIHDIMSFISREYKKTYAENTREVIRRQVIHQFEHARLVDKNPDNPNRPTNSGYTCYALTDEALALVKTFGSKGWDGSLKRFLEKQGKLQEIYTKRRQAKMIPVKFRGRVLKLSPGKHNALQVQVMETFGPIFAPGADVLYFGDTAKKQLYINDKVLAETGIPPFNHEKLPDVVLYDKNKNWLYLIEAVTTHGPVSSKRKHELELMCKDCKAGRIYVSAFQSLADLKKYLTEIAWETEIWIAEIPEHLIHFNGDRFIGPR